MPSLREFEEFLGQMSSAEKAQCPGIESHPDVCGGDACIVRTRIPVWLLEQARRLGVTEQMLLVSYPCLRAENLVNARNYARAHAAGIDVQILENESA